MAAKTTRRSCTPRSVLSNCWRPTVRSASTSRRYATSSSGHAGFLSRPTRNPLRFVQGLALNRSRCRAGSPREFQTTSNFLLCIACRVVTPTFAVPVDNICISGGFLRAISHLVGIINSLKRPVVHIRANMRRIFQLQTPCYQRIINTRLILRSRGFFTYQHCLLITQLTISNNLLIWFSTCSIRR